MCGILCLIENINDTGVLDQLCQECEKQIQKRGPDHYESTTIALNEQNVHMSASVLWLQGENLTEQPINTENALFSFNGDVFGGSSISTTERELHGDTKLLLEALETSNSIIDTLCQVYGPYAFIWVDKRTSNIFFGRDVFGRRSLLIGIDNESLIITSVATRTAIPFIEVPAIGIFSYNLINKNFNLFTWPKSHKNFDEKVSSMNDLLNFNVNIVKCLETVNDEFVMPQDKDLRMFEDLKSKTIENGFEHILANELWLDHVVQLNLKLENALNRRISTQPKYCKNCIDAKVECTHCRVGILFSGGVDCTILALIADKFIDKHVSIDLLNVAFDKVKDYNTPDRLTGLQSLEELQRLRPERHWHFVRINVTAAELDEARQSQIAHLIFPLNTVLDDSLGCALWFASKGETATYNTPCRVLLVGMGADELFGGYTRHRAAYKNHGWHGLHNTLADDWANIAQRNLARDDRVVSDHGRQLRTPYLDEEVVEYVQSLKVWEKTYPSADVAQGFGEKILLRTLAYYLGLRSTAGFKKRALQFGSRIADKKENAHEVSPRLVLL